MIIFIYQIGIKLGPRWDQGGTRVGPCSSRVGTRAHGWAQGGTKVGPALPGIATGRLDGWVENLGPTPVHNLVSVWPQSHMVEWLGFMMDS